MSRIIAAERKTYEEMWGIDAYATHSPGAQMLPLFLDMAGIPDAKRFPGTVLDAGCGAGKGALALAERGFAVTLCDITDARLPEVAAARTLRFHEQCLWHDLRPVGTFDYVYCCDVLEHLPPQFTMLAIDQMLRVSRRGVFLSICLVPDSFGIWAGKALHQTVQPYIWWRDSLATLGTVVESRDLLNDAVFLVRAR
jgi:SAM-dependent methyltransferase